MEGNGHLRTSKLLNMMMFRRVRHVARSRFGSSVLSDKKLYVSMKPKRWHYPRWLKESTKPVRPRRRAKRGDGSLQVV